MTDSKIDGSNCVPAYSIHTYMSRSLGEMTSNVTFMYGEDFTNIIRHKTNSEGDNTNG